jgi:hypothetical protein
MSGIADNEQRKGQEQELQLQPDVNPVEDTEVVAVSMACPPNSDLSHQQDQDEKEVSDDDEDVSVDEERDDKEEDVDEGQDLIPLVPQTRRESLIAAPPSVPNSIKIKIKAKAVPAPKSNSQIPVPIAVLSTKSSSSIRSFFLRINGANQNQVQVPASSISIMPTLQPQFYTESPSVSSRSNRIELNGPAPPQAPVPVPAQSNISTADPESNLPVLNIKCPPPKDPDCPNARKEKSRSPSKKGSDSNEEPDPELGHSGGSSGSDGGGGGPPGGPRRTGCGLGFSGCLLWFLATVLLASGTWFAHNHLVHGGILGTWGGPGSGPCAGDPKPNPKPKPNPNPAPCPGSGPAAPTLCSDFIALYDSDKTGMPDLALENIGGSIESTRHTKSLDGGNSIISLGRFMDLLHTPNKPNVIIQVGNIPGNCWSFLGHNGSVVIRLARPGTVFGFSLEHVSKKVSPYGHIRSAPRRFKVLVRYHSKIQSLKVSTKVLNMLILDIYVFRDTTSFRAPASTHGSHSLLTRQMTTTTVLRANFDLGTLSSKRTDQPFSTLKYRPEPEGSKSSPSLSFGSFQTTETHSLVSTAFESMDRSST